MWQIISTYLGIIIMTMGVLIFAKIVSEEKVKISKLKLFILIQIICMVHVIMFLYLAGTLKTIIMCAINTLLCKYIFRISIKKAIFITFLYMIILLIPDLLQLFFATKVLEISKDFYYNEFAGSLLGNFTTCILFLLLTLILKKPLRKIINTRIDNNMSIIIYSILTLICVGIFFYSVINKFRFEDNVILYLGIIFVFISIILSLIKQTMDNYKIKRDYDELLNFMTTYENEIEKQRILRHEIKNEFRTIRAKICDKQKNKEIIEYIDEIVNDKYEVKQEEYAKFGYLPPNGIKGLCYFKIQEAENKGIKVSINISKRVKNSVIYKLDTKQQRDFGRMLGVFLDNAIEASLESKEKQIGIEAYVNLEKEFEMIITNTYNNDIDKNKIGKESYSTKGKNRGHGLLLVKQLINKNNIFELKTEIQESLYIQKIKIKQL